MPSAATVILELVSVGNFSDSADTVDFTFDSKLDDSDGLGAGGEFVLILADGTRLESDAAAATGATADDETSGPRSLESLRPTGRTCGVRTSSLAPSLPTPLTET